MATKVRSSKARLARTSSPLPRREMRLTPRPSDGPCGVLVPGERSVPAIDYHVAVGRHAVEVQQHRLGFRLDDRQRDVVPGEGADRLGGVPERMRRQLNDAVVAGVAAQQVGAGEAGQLTELG